MKALTLRQPWATLIAIGAKTIETRSWWTAYRGPLAIHASKGFPKDCRALCQEEPYLSALTNITRADEPYSYALPQGAIVAVAILIDCRKISSPLYKDIGPAELAVGDYSVGRYAWYLEDIQGLTKPIPAKGSLGLWEWTEKELLGAGRNARLGACDG